MGSVEYLADFDEVKAKGVGLGMRCSTTVTSATRTADETVMGIYWGYDGARGLGTPPRLYNPCVRTIAEQEKTASAKTRDPDGSVRSHHKRQLTTRTAILENALSRVYLGVHWRFDGLGAPGVGGVAAGTKIAEEVFASYFKAVGPLRVPAAQAKRGKGFAKGRAQTKG